MARYVEMRGEEGRVIRVRDDAPVLVRAARDKNGGGPMTAVVFGPDHTVYVMHGVVDVMRALVNADGSATNPDPVLMEEGPK